MPVIRTKKDGNFSVMSNHHLRDKQISLKAKGLLSLMLSLPDDWKYSIRGLSAICKEGVFSIRNIVREPENHGYVERRQEKSNGGFVTEYYIYEQPVSQQPTLENQTFDTPTLENRTSREPTLENHTQ